MLKLERILVATDFTETSDRAVEYALDLAERLRASVTIVHAYEIPVVGFPDGSLIATPDLATRLAEVARAALDAVVERHRSRDVVLTSVLREGVPYEEINEVAKELDVDLIVVGTHGRRGLARALLGSIAENVIRTSTRPVLTLHGVHEHHSA